MIVSISLPADLVKDVDTVIRERGYKGRSEVARAALRDFLERHQAEDRLKGQVNAVVVLAYPESMERDLSDVRHAHNDLVKNMVHAHTNSQRCTTILQCEGPDHKMKRFFAQLRGLKALSSLQVSVL
jgi:CopG family transcriptional regulator, nickel-responsive regulator